MTRSPKSLVGDAVAAGASGQNREQAWYKEKARFALLSEVVLQIAKTPDLDQLLAAVVNKLKWVIDFERCTLALLNEDESTYALRTLMETRKDVPAADDQAVPVSLGLSGKTISTRQVQLIRHPARYRDELPPIVDPAMEDDETINCVLSLPLHAYGRSLGCITFGTRRAEGFNQDDRKIAASFSNHLSLAIERWRVHQALRASEERYALAMEGANEWIWDWNLATNEIYVSPRFLEFIGHSGKQHELSTDVWQSRVHDDDLPGFKQAMRAHLTDPGSTYQCEFRYRDGAGNYRWMLHRGVGLRDKAGRVHRMAGSLGDITTRKEAEENLRAAKEEAEQALMKLKRAQQSLIQAEKLASLGQLTAGIAHEIKNPLNFINNFSEVSIELLDELREAVAGTLTGLEADDRNEVDYLFRTLTENLGKISQHGTRADGIVKSMLMHSREGPREKQLADLNAIIEESLNLIYHGARAENPEFNITIERDLDPALGQLEVVSQDLMRVFLNLIGNGVQAAYQRSVSERESEFEPRLKATTKVHGNQIEVRIRDNGAGIPEQIRGKIFQPFFTTKPAGEGTGLGLSISYDIVVHQHGGTIEVESVVGEYTEFVVCLPRAAAPGVAQQ